jgi:hypothetical protein
MTGLTETIRIAEESFNDFIFTCHGYSNYPLLIERLEQPAARRKEQRLMANDTKYLSEREKKALSIVVILSLGLILVWVVCRYL